MTTFPTNGTVDNHLENPRTHFICFFCCPKSFKEDIYSVHLNAGFQQWSQLLNPTCRQRCRDSRITRVSPPWKNWTHSLRIIWPSNRGEKNCFQRKQQNWGISGKFGQPTGPNKSDDEFFSRIVFSPFLLGRTDPI